jgi:RNA polymerase sigma-70 factor, ECF subfamily
MPGVTRDSPTALWSSSANRIGRSGISTRSRRGGPRSIERWRSAAVALVLQAAIASLHAEEPQDWPQLAALYGELARLTGSPVVELNLAVAIAEAGDVQAALALVERLELDSYHYLHATRAELLRRLDRVEESRAAYDRALELVHSDAERRFLLRRLAELDG